MTNEELKCDLRESLLQVPYSKKINDKQIAIRCILCGDSKKHHDSAHMYIKLDINSDEPILFHCFKCNLGGLLTPSMLREMGIWDLNISGSLISYNNETSKKSNKINNKENNIRVKVPVYREINDNIIIKQNYINKRLGIDMSLQEMYNLKIIFSLKDFLRINDITPTNKSYKIDLLDKEYVGFISCRNEFIVFRNIENNKNKRYDKYPIFNSLENTRQFYSIPNKIDLLETSSIELNITEGIFDILGIYHHIYNKD